MTDVYEAVTDAARRATVAARTMRALHADAKNAALMGIAQALRDNEEAICRANAIDCQREEAGGMSAGLLDRLMLNPQRIDDIAGAVEHVAQLTDPIGQVVDGHTLPNGLQVRRVRVPMGVVAMIYEARPNVTVDAAALCIKSGNAALLRGGSAAVETNTVIVDVLRKAIAQAGLPSDAVQTLDAYGREGAAVMMEARGLVDVIIPRGGAGLIKTVVDRAKVPVIETGVGNCHIYVDASADPDKAFNIVLNAKTQRVGVCNAAETLLLDVSLDEQVAQRILGGLAHAGVTLHADESAMRMAQQANIGNVTPVEQDDWDREFLSMDIAVGVVEGVAGAVEHIAQHSSGHTECCIADSAAVLDAFTAGVDCAAVALNASTRFTDGGQLGLGAEIGISTQKLHARGPMGLAELTSTTWLIEGNGQVRH